MIGENNYFPNWVLDVISEISFQEQFSMQYNYYFFI